MTTITVSSGVTSSGLHVASGGVLTVLSGGVARSVQIAPQGRLIISSGGAVSEATVSSGGSETFSRGAVQSDVTISSGAELTLVDTILTSNSHLTIGYQVSSRNLSGATLMEGSELSTSGLLVRAGGDVQVLSTGSATSTTVLSGGGLDDNDGFVFGATISSGGTFSAEGAMVSGVTIDGYAKEFGSVDQGSVFYGYVQIEEGEKSYGAHLYGREDVLNSQASGTVIVGGDQNLGLLSVASGTIISSAGKQELHDSISEATVVSAGGLERVYQNGRSSDTRVLDGGLEDVLSNGVDRKTVVSSGGRLVVSVGGVDSAASIQLGGIEIVSAGGLASGAIVHSGGSIVLSGGGEQGAQVYNGGLETIGSGATATGTIVKGTERVASGGVADGTIVSAGAEIVLGGGVASGLSLSAAGKLVDNGRVFIGGETTFAGSVSGGGSIIKTGAGALVLSGEGSAFAGQATISCGTIELVQAGALGTGRVLFTPSTMADTLQIDGADAPPAGKTFANTISNFSGANDAIDLAGLAFVAGAKATLKGSTLTLSDGGQTYGFNLAGRIGAGFTVTSDGQGGTLITAAVGAMVQAAASLATSGGPVLANTAGAGTSGYSPLLLGAASASGRG